MEITTTQQCVCVYCDDQVLNVQPLIVLTQNLEGVAMEVNATANKEQILTAIAAALGSVKGSNPDATLSAIIDAVGNIDFSSLAKQGDNPNATNTAILEAFGNIDFTTLAKQGDDPTISLTSMDAKLGNVVMATAAEETAAMADLLNNLN